MKTLRAVLRTILACAMVDVVAWGQVNTFPYDESFDGAFPPTNWSVSHSGGESDWFKTASGTRTGIGAADSRDPGQEAHKYLSLSVDYTGNLAGTISYYVARTNPPSSEKTILVQYSTDGSTFTDLRSISVLNDLTTDTYTQFIDDLPLSLEGVATVTIRFDHTDATSTSGPDVKLDDFQITSGGPVPIQLASFGASVVRDNDVEVAWITISETNNYGFEIERSRNLNGVREANPHSEIGNPQWVEIAFVQGHGTTLAPQSYSYIDRAVPFGKYTYRIKQIDLDGRSETFPELEVSVGVEQDKFILAQNYPNPFNPSTTIDFMVPQAGWATVKIYNLLGQEVATSYYGIVQANKIYSTEFNALGLPSGVYFYQLRSAGKIETRRMTLMK